MRKFCPKCAMKHLYKALILQSEACLGYPEHYWLALANLSEADDELVAEAPELAETIRKERKAWEDDARYVPQILDLASAVQTKLGLLPDLPVDPEPLNEFLDRLLRDIATKG